MRRIYMRDPMVPISKRCRRMDTFDNRHLETAAAAEDQGAIWGSILPRETHADCNIHGGWPMRSVVAFVMSMVVSGAWAQEAKVPPGSRYCSLPSGRPEGADFLAALKNCRVGDVVIINRRVLYAVALRCDFSKSMVAVGDDVVCLIGPERPQTK